MASAPRPHYDASGAPLGGAPSAAGTYSVVASFNGSPDYAATQGKPLTFTIHPATPSVTVADAGRTYNGSAFAATALIAGVVRGIDNTPATDLENTGLGLTYYVGRRSPAKARRPPRAAGTYTVLASFNGSADYAPATTDR